MRVNANMEMTLDIARELIAFGLSQHAEKLICADLQTNDCLELQQK